MKTISTVLGLGIGDALGQPFEFCATDMIKKSGWNGELVAGPELIPYTMWNLKPGQWTDDTKMSLALADSLIKEGEFIAEKVAENYVAWVKSRDLRGIGLTCERAIYKMMKGMPLSETGKKDSGRVKPVFKKISQNIINLDTDLCGNGTVMRVAPIGIFYRNDAFGLAWASKEDANMTHQHPDARDASYALAYYIAALARGDDMLESLFKVAELEFEYPHVLNSISAAIEFSSQKISLEEVGSKMGVTGTADSTLGTAIYCFLSSPNFKEAAIKAVLMGGDTDSRGAIVGAMAGTYYGLEGIPTDWVEQVEDSKRLQQVDKDLLK